MLEDCQWLFKIGENTYCSRKPRVNYNWGVSQPISRLASQKGWQQPLGAHVSYHTDLHTICRQIFSCPISLKLWGLSRRLLDLWSIRWLRCTCSSGTYRDLTHFGLNLVRAWTFRIMKSRKVIKWTTVYPKKYAHFAVLCCGYTLTDFPISIRLTSLALWQSNDCPSASKATLMNMDKYFMWIHYERLLNHNKAKHNKTVCIFLGIYCRFLSYSNLWMLRIVIWCLLSVCHLPCIKMRADWKIRRLIHNMLIAPWT